ncbi:MAG: hypothetical protein HW402_1164 [Dehalococcoidales bacterium]|nr:hypothetical protein [Dehalococcoidales bacterium]
MKFLKGLALSFLGLLLFLSLSILGITFMLNRTLLNPDFVTSEVKRLDVSSLAEGMLNEGATGLPGEVRTALLTTIPKLEPAVKEQVSAALYSVYGYLLGKDESLDLALTLRKTLLKTDFVVAVVDDLDLSSLAKGYIQTQPTSVIPAEVKPYLINATDKAVADLKPWIKEQVRLAADPVLDYLVGKSQSFSVSIPLAQAKETLRVNLKEAFLKSPPPELAGVPPALAGELFDLYYQSFSAQLPSTFVLTDKQWGQEMRAGISESLAQAGSVLDKGRQAMGYVQLSYKLAIGLSLLLILAIALISLEVKGATRRLGTIFLTYGALEYAAIFAGKYFLRTWMPLPAMPPAFQTWVPQFIDNFMAPLATFSLVLAIGGVALIIVSFVYRSRSAEL